MGTMMSTTASYMVQLSNEELIDALGKERRKFTESDKSVMQAMIDELVNRKVYLSPEELKELYPRNPNNLLTMVECWGEDWHVWKSPLNCPHCSTDLRDHQSGPPFKRELGVYSQSRDRTVAWKCPDCSKEWTR